MKELIEKYGLFYGERFYGYQKKRFLNELYKDIKPYTDDLQIFSDKKGRSKHLAVNDLTKADVIVIASYDTLSKTVFGKYYPFNKNKSLKQNDYMLILNFVIFVMLAAVMWLLNHCISTNMQAFNIVTYILLCILLFVGTILYKGLPCKYNYNRNSISVVTLVNLIKNSNSKKIGFVFLDNASNSYQGYKEIREYISKKQKVIVLDALSSGDMLAFVSNESMQKDARQLAATFDHQKSIVKIYKHEDQNDRMNLFEKMLVITTGIQRERDFVVEESRNGQDYRIDYDRLLKINDSLIGYIQSI